MVASPHSARVHIVVDAMGGDRAPGVNVGGALEALTCHESLCITLAGQKPAIAKELERRGSKESERLKILHCDEVISMDDHAASGIRKKKNSSINMGLECLRDGDAHAFISAGNSGAVMAGALLILGRLGEVERPAIAVKLPTADGYVTVLDAGANVDCRPEHLVQFAMMGNVYSEAVEGIPNPRIGLLSNGSESHKGNELTRETHSLLSKLKGLTYRGYVEGFDLFKGIVDVVVCDGFVGNVLLKATEGLADTSVLWFRREVRRSLTGVTGIFFLRKILKKFRLKFDYQPYGAAPLLGVNGMVLISHGSSTEVAIRNGISTAYKAVEQGLLAKIRRELEQTWKQSAPEVNKTP